MGQAPERRLDFFASVNVGVRGRLERRTRQDRLGEGCEPWPAVAPVLLGVAEVGVAQHRADGDMADAERCLCQGRCLTLQGIERGLEFQIERGQQFRRLLRLGPRPLGQPKQQEIKRAVGQRLPPQRFEPVVTGVWPGGRE